MPRRPRFSQAGYVFHVLNRGAGRQTLFHTDHDYDAFVTLLEQAQNVAPAKLLAFCVMPNHWHLLLQPQTDDALSEYMRWLTTTHSQRWHAFRGTAGTGAVYQGRFKSFPVQTDEHFYAVCRYIERNALRANLVSRAELWRWGSLWHWRSNAAAVSLAAWPITRPPGWTEHVNEPQSEAELAAIRNSVTHGRPYGGTSWIRDTARTLGLDRTLHARGNPGRYA